MLRTAQKAKARKPVMVMLHGSGASGDIFGIQTHMLAKELSRTYDLVYLDGPTPSVPGPGVLPLFADMPGYYRWISSGSAQLSQAYRISELFEVARHIQEQLDEQYIRADQVVAFLGFSQGALMALALLGLRHAGQSAWTNLRFCVSIAGGASGIETALDGIENMIGVLAAMVERGDGKYPGYTVHAMGTQDAWHKDGRRLAKMCAEECTRSMNYREGHVVPRKRADVARLVQQIAEIDAASAAGGPISEAALEQTLPPMLTGGGETSIMDGLVFLASQGIMV